MNVELKNKPLIEALSGYSMRQLQFAIRLGVLPTPDKLSRILRKKYASKKDVKLLAKGLSELKG